MNCSLDTNLVLALILPEREKEHFKATKLLAENECHVADIVFAEIEFVLRKIYGLPRAIVVVNLRAITNHPKINSNKTLINKALPLYQKHSALSFVDCYLLIHAELNNLLPLYTFDKKLANQSSGKAKQL